MHENREISSTPWSDDQGRSAKVINRTADMHVPEKSDCAVLPVNQPNKGGQSSAEAGEGRAQTKENIVQSHRHSTQSGKRMSQGLDGVRKAAKERKQERFTALLHHLNVDLLRDERWPPALFHAALDGSIKRSQVQTAYQCPNGSRRVVFADEVFHIYGSPTHLFSVHVADQRLFAGGTSLAHAASLRQTVYFATRKFRRFLHSFYGTCSVIR